MKWTSNPLFRKKWSKNPRKYYFHFLEKSGAKTPCKSGVKIQGNIISTFFSIFYRDFAPLFLKVDLRHFFLKSGCGFTFDKKIYINSKK